MFALHHRVMPIRIEVISEDDCTNPQARTYAEYRLFAALAPHTRQVRSARVTLRRDERNGTCDAVVCAVAVGLTPRGSIRTDASSAHAYEAINRAVDRIGDLLVHRTRDESI
jgi:ribosome-associated translation inhibitor RaiA